MTFTCQLLFRFFQYHSERTWIMDVPFHPQKN
jgi:hypothetical protein